MRGLRVNTLSVVALAFALSGCTAAGNVETPGTSHVAKLSIGNWTTITVTLVVNGSVIETVPPGGYEDPIKGNLPPLPWNVKTLSPSGRVLSSLVVHPGDFGDSVRKDLSCGRLDLWYRTPMIGPTFVPGPSGDCA